MAAEAIPIAAKPTEKLAQVFEAAQLSRKIVSLDWPRIETDLHERGCATTGAILTARECARIAADYESDTAFRSRVVMARHGFGRGEYKYFNYPLPGAIAELRTGLYPHLAKVANRWNQQLGIAERYPEEHKLFLDRCHAAGQRMPTPLLLKYAAGDYNCLHQDLYGIFVFPLQVAFLLSAPGEDFTGGEFALTEQRHACNRGSRSLLCSKGKG